MTLSGTITHEPKMSDGTHGLYAHFTVLARPNHGNGDDGQFKLHVTCGRPLSENVRDKVKAGDRVLVQGRMGAYKGELCLRAHVVAIDLRSLPVLDD